MNNQKRGYLKRLPPGFSSGSYFGFTLKKDFLYGYDERGTPIAFSGFHTGNQYFIYKLIDEKWEQRPIGFGQILSLLSENN